MDDPAAQSPISSPQVPHATDHILAQGFVFLFTLIIIALMLHAPLIVTTAKLDISLLLKSSPSPPPATSAPRQSSLSSATTSAPVAALSQPPPPRPVSSHRTSTSSNISTASRYGTSNTPSQVYSQPQRPYLPPIAGPSAPHLSPQVPSQTFSSTHPPAKRPPPTQAHPAASPAKKQSKWTAEEDALIIDLRGSGMKWEDISKRLPGRSAISCRLHYQNYLERRSEWDEERKNRLARLYER